jgi:UDP-N-acetylglucosamine 2-epimerase (non-hydrolysing)
MNKMKKIKIMTIVGTRPELIRLSVTIKLLAKYTDHILVHTGQNYDYELNEIFFKDLGLPKPDFFLGAADASPSKTVGAIISATDEVLAKCMPDAVFVLGDTNSALATYAAKRRKIPVFHAEAGNRCFDVRVPEELNRKIIDHISDINMVYSDEARNNLTQEGLPLGRIIKIGSPMAEVLAAYKPQIDKSQILATLSLSKKEYFLFSLHRDENVSPPENIAVIAEIIKSISATYKKKIIFPMHPRTKKAFKDAGVSLEGIAEVVAPLGFFDFVHLQQHALCVFSDSGTISEESSLLGLTALNFRESHERLEAMDEAAVMMVGLNPERVLQALHIVLTEENWKVTTPRDYQCDNVSKKILRIIVSYLDPSLRKIHQG